MGLQKNGMKVVLYCFSDVDNFDLCPVVVIPKIGRNPLLQFLYSLKTAISLVPYLSVVRRYIALERKEGTKGATLWKRVYLNSHLLKSKPDWLHFGYATMAIGSETVAKAIGAKMAVSFRGFDVAVYPVKNPGCYNLLWKYVDKIHIISDDLLVLAKKHGMPDTIAVEKITPAIDVNLFQSALPDFGIIHKPVFMTTGRLHWKKGLVQTIEALTILKNKGIDFTYKIIGEGQDYERIAFAAYQLGIKDRVQFLGKLPQEEVKQHLEGADVYIQYSIQEGFCNAVLEAQAMGKLCVVSDAEGLTENVLHGQTGWVVPKYSPELLAERIEKVLRMTAEDKKTISQNAVQRVKKEFNIEKQEREFMEFYK